MTNKQFIETFVTLCEGYGIGPWEVYDEDDGCSAEYFEGETLFILEASDYPYTWLYHEVVWYELDSPQAYADKVREILKG